MQSEIRHLFFDVGDTLRVTHKIPAHQLHAKKRVADLLGTDMEPEAFARLLDERYEGYRNDATVSFVESDEETLWTKWLAPDFPASLVRPLAVELTFLFRQFRGKRLLAPNALEVIQALCARGYQLGIISNVITSKELPEWIEQDGLAGYFHPVVLSSLTGIRKPDPAIFHIALQEAAIKAQYCAYIGDNVERDIGGAKAVGFGMTILINLKNQAHTFRAQNRPDAIIQGLTDLLDVFPGCPQVNAAAPQIV